MKLRNGFVSNSSSSSFVLIVAKETHDEVLKELGEDAKFFEPVEDCDYENLSYVPFSEDTFLGNDVVVFHHTSDSGGYGNFMSTDEVYKAFNKYKRKVKQHKGSFLITDEGN